jgi:hypothetical protein
LPTRSHKPNSIGRLSSTLGEAGINIVIFDVGRDVPGANGIVLIEVEGEVLRASLLNIRGSAPYSVQST